MSNIRSASIGTLAMISAILTGCGGRKAQTSSTADLRKGGADEVTTKSYPPGRWRLATFEQLSKSVVWVSHVVVMHRASRPGEFGLRPRGWSPDAVPDRSREEAYKIALAARNDARANPATFAAVVGKYSDDAVTRARGGSLGGVQVTQLTPTFVDTLAALQPGEVSDVVETPMGFHVVLLRQPPPAVSFAGARIVVRYASTEGDEPSTRTRDEAKQLATSITSEARSGADFEALARRRSDNPDRIRGGSMGVWSAREPNLENALVLEALTRMAEGEVSDPIDSPIGFQVVKRIATQPATEFAMRAVRVPIGVLSGSPGESSATLPDPARQEAEAIAVSLRRDPASFSQLTKDHCCRHPARWADGHSDPVMTSALEKLGVGEWTTVPLRIPGYYVVGQRLDPESVALPDKPSAGIPSPSAADIDEVVRAVESSRLATKVDVLTAAVKDVNLPPDERAALTRVLERFRSDLSTATTEEARLSAYHNELGKLYNGLSESGYAHVQSILDRWATSQILAPNGS